MKGYNAELKAVTMPIEERLASLNKLIKLYADTPNAETTLCYGPLQLNTQLGIPKEVIRTESAPGGRLGNQDPITNRYGWGIKKVIGLVASLIDNEFYFDMAEKSSK